MCQDVHNRVNFCRIVKEPRHKGSFFHQNTNLRNEVEPEKKEMCVCIGTRKKGGECVCVLEGR